MCDEPQIRINAEFDPYDSTLDWDKRFLNPVDCISLKITNLSIRSLTIEDCICTYKDISKDKDTCSISGRVFDSFIDDSLKGAAGKKLKQSDMVKIEIKDSKVLDHLIGFSVKSTYGDSYILDPILLQKELKKRSEYWRRNNDSLD